MGTPEQRAREEKKPSIPEDALDFQSPQVPRERLDLRILSALRRIIRAVDIYSKRLATDYGITVPQLMCMLKIDELGSLTIKELSREIYLNPSTIVGIVDRLEKNGIVKRTRSVRDRRKVRLNLTDKGMRVLENAPSPLQEKLANSIDELPELEKLTIAASLNKIISLMEDSSPDAIGLKEIPQEPVLETSSNLQEQRDEAQRHH